MGKLLQLAVFVVLVVAILAAVQVEVSRSKQTAHPALKILNISKINLINNVITLF